MKELSVCMGMVAGILTSGFVFAGDMGSLLKTCSPNIHPKTMGSIVANESEGNPYAIFDNGLASLPRAKRVLRTFRPQTKQDAIAIANNLIAAGHIVDLGLGQVNNSNLKWLGFNAADMFDPCRNLKASESVLLGFYERAEKAYGAGQQALLAAISGYNTGSLTAGFRNGYVKKVIAASQMPIPDLQVAPPFPGSGIVRVVQNATSGAAGSRGVLARRPALLEAKFASLEVDTF